MMDNKIVIMSRKQRFWIDNSVLERTLNQRVAGSIPASPITQSTERARRTLKGNDVESNCRLTPKNTEKVLCG